MTETVYILSQLIIVLETCLGVVFATLAIRTADWLGYEITTRFCIRDDESNDALMSEEA